jgi:hypothetical protein
MRMIVIKQETDLQGLSARLLSARLASNKAHSALEALQALNPHVNLKKVAAGTVLLVPDAPGFKAAASDPVPANALADFQQLVQTGLGAAAAKLKTGNADRDARRADVTAVLKLPAVQRIVATDPDVRQQLDEAVKAVKNDQQREAEAVQTLDTATKGALAELAAVAKLLG